MPESLLTIKDVARYLGLPEEEVKRLVDEGEIPAYKIGGTFLRFRKEQIEAIKNEIRTLEEKEPERAKAHLDSKGRPSRPYTDLEREIKRREPMTRQYDYTFPERIKDFWYFCNFYVLSTLFIVLILYIIILQT